MNTLIVAGAILLIAGQHLFSISNTPHGIATTAWQIVDTDAVIRNSKTGNYCLSILRETPSLLRS